MIYWTKNTDAGTSIKFKAYKKEKLNNSEYVLLDSDVLAEVYIFNHKSNHGSCMGMIAGGPLTHFLSRDLAFETISKQLK